jgi:hypothetical protein
MPTVLVLFNLKPGINQAEYEEWAKTVDLPTVNDLESVDRFEVLRANGLLMGEGNPPYQYFEILRVNDMEKLGHDIASETMQQISNQFQSFADGPIFVLTDSL